MRHNRPTLSREVRAGFTLVEIMLALALSSLVALTALLMLRALGTVTESRFDKRTAIVEREIMDARLGTSARTTAKALASSGVAIVLWKGDTNENGVPDLSELRRIEWDVGESRIASFDAPDPIGTDVSYALGDDFLSITDAAAGSSTFPGRVLIDRVKGFEASLDNADVLIARTARFVVTTDLPSGEQTTTIIASFRGESQ